MCIRDSISPYIAHVSSCYSLCLILLYPLSYLVIAHVSPYYSSRLPLLQLTTHLVVAHISPCYSSRLTLLKLPCPLITAHGSLLIFFFSTLNSFDIFLYLFLSVVLSSLYVVSVANLSVPFLRHRNFVFIFLKYSNTVSYTHLDVYKRQE